MTAIRLLAIDLDDTLLRRDLTISLRTRSTLRKAEAAGVIVVLASGRAPQAMTRYARDLNLHKREGFLISNNGATIQRSDTGETVYESRLNAETALLIFNLVDSEDMPVQVYRDDTIYVSRRSEFGDLDQKLTGFKQVVVDDFRSLLTAGELKLVIPGDPCLLRPLEILLRSIVGDKATLFTSKPYFLEALPPNCGKGEALALVAGKLGLARDQTMAIGDSMNDESMIRWAAYSVAMRNGDERIKAQAAIVTDLTNEEDGVADTVERYILGGDALPSPKSEGTSYVR